MARLINGLIYLLTLVAELPGKIEELLAQLKQLKHSLFTKFAQDTAAEETLLDCAGEITDRVINDHLHTTSADMVHTTANR